MLVWSFVGTCMSDRRMRLRHWLCFDIVDEPMRNKNNAGGGDKDKGKDKKKFITKEEEPAQ